MITDHEGSESITKKDLSNMVNACVNQHPDNNYKSKGLYERVEEMLAELFPDLTIGKPNKMENRRWEWGTYDNVNIWYSSFKHLLIEQGFAREKSAQDVDVEGELVYFPGQENRICNIDETGLAADSTNTAKGGRPAGQFYDSTVRDNASTRASKSSFSCTMMGAVTMTEPIPPHFQFPTEATSVDNMRLPAAIVEHMKNLVCSFGQGKTSTFPVTLGTNVKGGFTANEFQDYILGYVKYWPDAMDSPGKRVLILVDDGPGRRDIETLRRARGLGLVLFPAGPPNCTHLLQIMDELYGLFKSRYYENLDVLYQELLRVNGRASITREHVGLLVFGGPASDREGAPILTDLVALCFSEDKIKAAWAKLGIKPFTRNVLTSKKLRHERMIAEDRTPDNDADPLSEHYKELQDKNDLCCDILNYVGFNGEIFRRKISERSTQARKAQLTIPHTKGRIEALKNASGRGSGGMFVSTGGHHRNSDDVFVAAELHQLEAQLKSLKVEKNARQVSEARERAAKDILKTRREFTAPEYTALIEWKR